MDWSLFNLSTYLSALLEPFIVIDWFLFLWLPLLSLSICMTLLASRRAIFLVSDILICSLLGVFDNVFDFFFNIGLASVGK